MNHRKPVQHLEFEPRASDFLGLLRDLGHLDQAAFDKITAALVSKPRADGRITLEEVRRAAAAHLFEAEGSLRPDQKEILAGEWPRLFY